MLLKDADLYRVGLCICMSIWSSDVKHFNIKCWLLGCKSLRLYLNFFRPAVHFKSAFVHSASGIY